VHSGGAKFDYEKAKWFNHEWIKQSGVVSLEPGVKELLIEKGLKNIDDLFLEKVISLIKDRCTLLTDFYDQSYFFFKAPEQYDLNAVKPKWSDAKKRFFELFIEEIKAIDAWESAFIEDGFKKLALMQNIKPGELQLPFRIMLVGGKFGPPVFDIVTLLGKEKTIQRIEKGLLAFG
jgi:glutamyl-tRNA synthetase